MVRRRGERSYWKCTLFKDSEYTTNLRHSFLLGTEDNLNILRACQNLVIDGLLPGKTTVLYQNLLQQLEEVADITPGSVLMDFEAAMRKAVLAVWPSTTIRGCFFHFCQAFWRNFQKHDLVPESRFLAPQSAQPSG